MDAIAAGAQTTSVARAPSAAVLCAVVVAGLAAAACTILLALTSNHIPEPGVHAGLAVWGILGFVLAGVVAWWRRPESRFGILMVLAGTAWFLSTLSSANLAVPYTIGLTFDLVPAIVFLHVVLAFPSGRLERPFERALVGVGYATAVGVHLFGMTLGGFGPDNLFEIDRKCIASGPCPAASGAGPCRGGSAERSPGRSGPRRPAPASAAAIAPSARCSSGSARPAHCR